MGVNFDLLALNSDQRMREPHLTLSLPSIITHKIMIKLHTGKYSFDLTISGYSWFLETEIKWMPQVWRKPWLEWQGMTFSCFSHNHMNIYILMDG